VTEELGIELGAGIGPELQAELVLEATGTAPMPTVGNPSAR
jgi:hypothetical protein